MGQTNLLRQIALPAITETAQRLAILYTRGLNITDTGIYSINSETRRLAAPGTACGAKLLEVRERQVKAKVPLLGLTLVSLENFLCRTDRTVPS